MGIRSDFALGFHAWGVEAGGKANLTLIGRAAANASSRSRRGPHRIRPELSFVEEESAKHGGRLRCMMIRRRSASRFSVKPAMTIDKTLGSSSRGLARAWAAATRARIRIAARPSSSACWRGSRRSARRHPQCKAIRALRRHCAPGGVDSVRISRPARGILAGSTGRRRTHEIVDIASVPALPIPADDLVERLHAARAAGGQPLACARSGDWRHPVVGLWPWAAR